MRHATHPTHAGHPSAIRGSNLSARAIAALLFDLKQPGFFIDTDDWSTLFQDTAGTTPVTAPNQGVALALDKRLGLELGPELVTNGTFDTDLTEWNDASTGTATVTVSDGAVVISGTDSANRGILIQGIISAQLVLGRTYEVSFDVLATDGGIQAGVGVVVGGTAGVELSTSTTGKRKGVFLYEGGTRNIWFRTVFSGSTATIDNVSVRELAGNHARQATTAQRPAYQTTPDRLVYDGVDDNMVVDFGAAFAGDVFQGTVNGVLHYAISTAGTWKNPQSAPYRPDNGTVTATIAREGSLAAGDVAKVKTYLREETGAGADFAGVAGMAQWFRGRTDVTAIYAGDWNTASVTNFNGFARNCSSLTTLDVSNWNTASVTNFGGFAFGCSSLTTVTVNGGTGNPFADSPCTNYGNAFLNTNLTQDSIDDILVAIELAGTSNGTFFQSGGSAPSATGEAAVTALRARGWTVTVTGGF